jgi:hypothetical protein
MAEGGASLVLCNTSYGMPPTLLIGFVIVCPPLFPVPSRFDRAAPRAEVEPERRAFANSKLRIGDCRK